MARYATFAEEFVCTGCGASTLDVPWPGEAPDVVHALGCQVELRQRVDRDVNALLAVPCTAQEN